MKLLVTIILIYTFNTVHSQGSGNSEGPRHMELVIMEDVTVRQFVEQLRMQEVDSERDRVLHTLGQQGADWIKEEDVKYLMSLIDSKEKSKCIMQSISSNWPEDERPILGDQIILLIDAFRYKTDFPNKGSMCAKFEGTEKRIELRTWWDQYKLNLNK